MIYLYSDYRYDPERDSLTVTDHQGNRTFILAGEALDEARETVNWIASLSRDAYAAAGKTEPDQDTLYREWDEQSHLLDAFEIASGSLVPTKLPYNFAPAIGDTVWTRTWVRGVDTPPPGVDTSVPSGTVTQLLDRNAKYPDCWRVARDGFPACWVTYSKYDQDRWYVIAG